MNKLTCCLLALVIFLAAPAYSQTTALPQASPLDGIVAVVNEEVILQSELDRAVANITRQYADRQDQLPPANVLQRQVLERLILLRLQASRAKESGVTVSEEEVDAAVNSIAAQNNMTLDQMRQQLGGGESAFNDFRATIRDELIVQRLRQSFAQGRINVSDGEVDAAMSAPTASATQYRLAHILVAVPEGATPDQITTAQQKIDGVKNLIDKGELDFTAAAVRYSDSPNALEGGDLGWRSIDEIPTAFTATISTMQPGQVIGPVRGPSGFQLLTLTETRDAANANSTSVTQYQARHILIRTGEASEPNAGDAPLDEAQAKAKIDTLRARIDGGADFAELAKENSDDVNTSSKGGDLGWFTQDAFGVEFGSQLAALQDGQVSPAFKTQAGWHLVQRIGTKQAPVDDKNRRAQVRETIGQRKLEEEWSRFLRELRGEAFIDIRNDPAAKEDPITETPPAANGG